MSLVAIAQEMRRRLDSTDKGCISRSLFGGLVIVYERRHRSWRLAIGRETSPPSKAETETIAKSFGVPVGTEWSWSVKKRKPRGTWQIAECTWLERENTNDQSDRSCE